MKILQTLLLAIAFGGIILAIFVLMGLGFDSQEKFECYQWQNQAKKYAGFYLTKWQSEQCDHWNIKIDAQVQ